MTKRTKRFWLIAMCVAALSVVSAMPASADVSRVIYFPIQNNIGCDDANLYSTFRLNVTNVGAADAIATVYLYTDNGMQLTNAGISGSGATSNITPGVAFTLTDKQTKKYNISFGSSFTNLCSERPAFGKIVINNDAGYLLATGESRSIDKVNRVVNEDVPVIINGGQPF